jgi:CRP/FNR family transcriptional regulator
MTKELSTLTSLSTGELKALSGFFECKNVPEGDILWKEGDSCDYVAFIASGRVKITKETEFKGNPVVLGIYGTGAFIGALCILDESPRAVTAETLEETSLMIITRENFDRLMKKHPELWGKFLKGILISVSKRLRGSFERMMTLF